ncbi:MAG: TetR/AcrR family transcriptional regulator [Polyangiaceae bacterium]|jgi:hypothetical protein|nr:TetR/AcrR family transcriptional regulator [Polyangiaceae bacterium]
MSVPERRQREREQRRDRVLDTAERLFLERGFDAVTMHDVAAQAEVGEGTLHVYFKHKHDLLGRPVLRRSGSLLQRFGEAAADGGIRAGLDPVNLAVQLWEGPLGAWLVQIILPRVGEKAGRPIDLAAFSDPFMHMLLGSARRPPPDHAPAGPSSAEFP